MAKSLYMYKDMKNASYANLDTKYKTVKHALILDILVFNLDTLLRLE